MHLGGLGADAGLGSDKVPAFEVRLRRAELQLQRPPRRLRGAHHMRGLYSDYGAVHASSVTLSYGVRAVRLQWRTHAMMRLGLGYQAHWNSYGKLG